MFWVEYSREILEKDFPRQCAWVLSASDSLSRGPRFQSRSDHYPDLFHGRPRVPKSSNTLVNSQLTYLRAVGFLTMLCSIRSILSVVYSAPLAFMLLTLPRVNWSIYYIKCSSIPSGNKSIKTKRILTCEDIDDSLCHRKSSAIFGNFMKFSENVRGRSSGLRNSFRKTSEIFGKRSGTFGKSSKTPPSVCLYNKKNITR